MLLKLTRENLPVVNRENLPIIIISLWAASATIFHLYSASIGFYEPRVQRSLHLAFLLPLIFVCYPTFRDKKTGSPTLTWVDWLLAGVALIPCLYSYFHANRINLRLEDVDPVLTAELVMGIIAIVLVFEALRRAVSAVMAGLVFIGFIYLFTTEYYGGFWGYRNLPLDEIVEAMYLTNGHGIFGSITGISATMVAIFICFGAFIEGSGAGRLFNNAGVAVAGRYSGGPAKVAVCTSALFGTMSGSSSSNVFTTGSFTIPMMKRMGYRSAFAGGVETAASVGGQSAPPIMGAGAFIMAEITNTPYADIIIAAILGSLCYFTMIFISVHLEAKKNGLKGMAESDIPSWREIARDAHLIIPIILLVVLLMMRFSPYFAAFYTIVATIIVSSFRKHTRMGPKKMFEVIVNAGKNMAPIAIACVGAGMMITVLTKTGVVVSLGSLIASFSGGIVWVAGLLLMFTTLLLGMGVPTTPAYVITAAIGAPTLISDFGIPLLGAHMFVFYFAILADATPPVSIAAYAAASIAKAGPLATGFQASRIAIAGYIVGYSYLFVPELRMEGEALDIIGYVLVILSGLTVFSAGLTGYFSERIVWPLRVVLIPAGIALSLLHNFPPWPRVGIALIILVGIYLHQRATHGRFSTEEGPAAVEE